MKVCEKVEGKGRTTYNEVADELVNDLPGSNDPGENKPTNQYCDRKTGGSPLQSPFSTMVADIIDGEWPQDLFDSFGSCVMLTWLHSAPSQQGAIANGSTGCLDRLEKHIST